MTLIGTFPPASARHQIQTIESVCLGPPSPQSSSLWGCDFQRDHNFSNKVYFLWSVNLRCVLSCLNCSGRSLLAHLEPASVGVERVTVSCDGCKCAIVKQQLFDFASSWNSVTFSEPAISSYHI